MLDTQTGKGEIILTESFKPTTKEEVAQYFKPRIDDIKEMKVLGDIRLREYRDNSAREKEYMYASWSWAAFSITMSNLAEMWELLQDITLEMVKGESETSNFKEQFAKLNSEFRKYSPTLRTFKEALDQTKKTLMDNQ